MLVVANVNARKSGTNQGNINRRAALVGRHKVRVLAAHMNIYLSILYLDFESRMKGDFPTFKLVSVNDVADAPGAHVIHVEKQYVICAN